ncbi:ribose 5-phosphate isomerase A, partial [Phenoliferia sp. Uapishka_3]
MFLKSPRFTNSLKSTFKPRFLSTAPLPSAPSAAALSLAKAAASNAAIKGALKPTHNIIGVGSGSTMISLVEALKAEQLEKGEEVNGRWFIPTGTQSQSLLEKAGLRVGSVDQFETIDIAFDGADDIDTDLDAIKGGGACHLREKIIAQKSRYFVLVADWRKETKILGTGLWEQGVPIEVVPFAANSIKNDLATLSWSKGATLRMAEDGTPLVTDNGNYIIDAKFKEGVMANPAKLHDFLKLMTGVVDVGLFVDLADEAYFGLEVAIAPFTPPTSMTNIQSLPPELVSNIFDSVSPHPSFLYSTEPPTGSPGDRTRDLRAICLTSHFFCALAEPILYADLYIPSPTPIRRLLASDAFKRQRTVSTLQLTGWSEEVGVDKDVVELLTQCGKKRLRKLTLHRFGLSASVLERAGSELRSLELSRLRIVIRKGEAIAARLPFQLIHFGLHGFETLPPTLISLLLSSPRLESLGISISSSPSHLRSLISLPQFPSVAAHIKIVTVEDRHTKRHTTSLPDLSSFTSLSHLNLQLVRSVYMIRSLIQSLPDDSPTVSHLTLGLRVCDFGPEFTQDWREIMLSEQLKKLEIVSWPFIQECHVSPELYSLDLLDVTIVSGESTNLPFQLVHLGWARCNDIPQSFLSRLISSPKLKSFDMDSFSTSSPLSALLSLPEFPSIAAKITSLAFFPPIFERNRPDSLAAFVSISHLHFPFHETSLHEILQSAKKFPTDSPTITHLTLTLSKSEFDSALGQEMWKEMMGLEQLKQLDLITWTWIDGNISGELLEVLQAGREEVRMEWCG